jgi:hypothetical protein
MRLFLFISSLILFGSCSLLNVTPSKKVNTIQFEQQERNTAFQFFFPDPATDTILIHLRTEYQLEQLVQGAKNEEEKVLRVLKWARSQWEHVPSNNAETNNACTILDRAKKGERFRCVEYGIVLKSALNALGLKARTIGLKTRDVESTLVAAGHVLAEVWLQDRQKWAMVDAQFDAMPVLDGVPLNAVELQSAIVQKRPFQFIRLQGPLSDGEHKQYMKFIPHYLFYFDVSFDEKNLKRSQKYEVDGKYQLMLVPIGAKKPTVFQRKYPMDYLQYTHSLADFYAKPL